jgi:hypothetical protein
MNVNAEATRWPLKIGGGQSPFCRLVHTPNEPNRGIINLAVLR